MINLRGDLHSSESLETVEREGAICISPIELSAETVGTETSAPVRVLFLSPHSTLVRNWAGITQTHPTQQNSLWPLKIMFPGCWKPITQMASSTVKGEAPKRAASRIQDLSPPGSGPPISQSSQMFETLLLTTQTATGGRSNYPQSNNNGVNQYNPPKHSSPYPPPPPSHYL